MRRLVLAVLSLVLVVPAYASSPAAAEGEPGATGVTDTSARKFASQRQVALATPGDFTGYGFDQCLAPTQAAMDTWWKKSPFSAVGIYISGDSRACRSQPNRSISPARGSNALASAGRNSTGPPGAASTGTLRERMSSAQHSTGDVAPASFASVRTPSEASSLSAAFDRDTSGVTQSAPSAVRR